MDIIYLDYNATTPVDLFVAEAMRPYLEENFGNPSSIHEYGRMTRMAVELSRKQVADFLGCNPDEIIFTSGGTESNNYALKGVASALRSKGNHIITSSIEHPSVTEVCKYLERSGFRITWLPVDEYGMVNPADVESAITSRTILVSIMHANNEVGTIQQIKDIRRITSQKGIIFHTDAAQTCGKIDVRVDELGVDLLSVAGHKLYGPKGIGALYVRRGTQLEKLIHGADHEMNRRAGTENVMEIVGLGKACDSSVRSSQFAVHSQVILELRDLLYTGIKDAIPEVHLNGHPEYRLPNTLSLSFPGVDASRLLTEMRGIAASAGAACHSDRTDISAVLTAMGVPLNYAIGTIRFSLGRMTTKDEVTWAVPRIVDAYRRISGNRQLAVSSQQFESGFKLTQYTSSLGCACKIRPQMLEKILKDIPLSQDPSILVDLRTNDDASVYRIDEPTAIVQTIDFIPPVVDDPYNYGAIASANALSDIYAMGGKPLFALSIVAFPDKLLPSEVLKEIIRGATDKAAEAGISIIGGHSVEDTEPKFGLVVTGSIDPTRIITNSNAKPGDTIILTKPLGTGILATGLKRGLIDKETENRMITIMAELNRKACEIMLRFPVNACTDVTGFGLLGHLKEMVVESNVSAEIFNDKVPVLTGVMELLTGNIVPGGTRNNLDHVSDIVEWNSAISEMEKLILADAQTSGGLLISIPSELSDGFLEELKVNGISKASIIGRFTGEGKKILVSE
jgi:cysteine desulfurase NifS/selenium donor protein